MHSLDPPEGPYIAVMGLLEQTHQIPVSPAEIVVFLLLLLASAVVSGSEVALFSLSPTDKETLSGMGDRKSKHVLALLEKPRQLLVTILFLNTVVNVSVAILAAVVTKNIVEVSNLPSNLIFALEVVALTLTLLIISEITPKLIASRYSVAYSRRIASGLAFISRPLFPVTFLLTKLTDSLQKVYHNFGSTTTPDILSSEDLRAMAEIGKDHGSIEEDEQRWIHSLLNFGETTVRSIMVNRLDISAIPVTASLGDALELIRLCGHSRLPLYKDHLDNIQGIIYAKDLLEFLNQKNSEILWDQIMRPPIFVPLGRKLDDLLQDFQHRKTHIAIAVDEYGGTAGLVTLDDVLEEVVGEIEDEHDEARDTLITSLGNQEYKADARISLIDLNETLDHGLQTDDNAFKTLGGLIFHLAGDIPESGFTTIHNELELTVINVENNRIGMVHIRILSEANKSNEAS